MDLDFIQNLNPLSHGIISPMIMTETEINWLKNNLGKIDFLNALSADQVEDLIQSVTPRVLAGNQPVIQEGELGKAFFIIFSGEINVWVERNGRQSRLANLRPGDYFGEISLLTGKPTTANVFASTPSKVFFLDGKKFVDMVKSNKELANHIVGVMRKRLEHRKKEVLELMVGGDLNDINNALQDFLKD